MNLDRLTEKEQKAIVALAEWFIENCWKKATLGQQLDLILKFTGLKVRDNGS